MKRFLSTLLALALIISLVPVTFATEGDAEAQEYSGITVKYDFTKFEGAGTISNNVKEITSYDSTYGFWKYAMRGGSGKNSRAVELKTTHKHVYVVARDNRTEESDPILASTDWVAFEIKVPKAGKYSVIVNNNAYGVQGATAGLWILPGSTSNKETTINELLTEETMLGKKEFDFVAQSYGGKKSYYEENVTIADYNFTTDTYLVVYKVLHGNKYSETDREIKNIDNGDMYLRGITLDGDGAEAEKAIPMSMVTSVDEPELKIGSNVTTAQMTSKVYMSNLAEVTEGITYTSNDENIATVDGNGLVTAKAYGVNPVTITASATIDGYEGYPLSKSAEVTVNADGIEIVYDLAEHMTEKDMSYQGKDADYTLTPSMTELTYDYTNGFYKYFDSSSETDRQGANLKYRKTNIQLSRDEWVAFEVYIPAAGTYAMKMYNGVHNKSVGTAKVYVNKDVASYETGYEGSYSCLGTTANFGKCVSDPNVVAGIEIPEAGTYVITFYADGGYSSVGKFTLTNGTGLDPVPMPAMIKLGADKLEVGEATTAEVIKYLSDGNPAEGATFSDVTSSNSDVVTVDKGGTVTANGTGTATLSATVTYNDNIENLTREVTVVDIGADKTITIAVDENGDGIAAVDSSKAVGDSYTVTAADRSSENLEFRGWVRGSVANGTWVSNEKTYTFTVTTNTYLTAVYSAVATEANPVTEYYNWNREYLGTEKVTPTLTGYSFREWVTTKVSDFLSRAVAQYDVENTGYNVTTDGDFDISVEGGKYVYDAKVTCEAGDAVYWYRDGKCVDYGETYSFNVWGNTEITTSATGSTGAKVILDEVEKTTGTTEMSYMIEYDKGDKNIVEVGILFGDDFEPTVEKCSEKMTSQRNNAHGQFSATSACSNVRGYLIYNDNGTYRVIYAN